MLCRTSALLCALTLFAAGSCLLDEKQVGGEALEQPPPDPCELYCDRVAACLDEDETLCVEACPDGALDSSCRAAQLSVLSCLDVSSCEEATEVERECSDALDARDESCGT